MGYILPITQFEYKDYQVRSAKERIDKHFIEKPFKVTLDAEQKSVKERYVTRSIVNKQNTIGTEQLYTNLTGKGKLFNEII